MVSKFIKGKYYRWVGPPDFWFNWNHMMNKVKDGKPRLCITENTLKDTGGKWEWYHAYKYFEEYHKPAQMEFDF